MKRQFVRIAVALAGLLASFSLDAQTPPVVIRAGHFPNITHSQGVIGQANGWFDKALAPQARVEWKIFNAGPSAIEALFAGAIDLTYIGPNPAINGYVRGAGGDPDGRRPCHGNGAVVDDDLPMPCARYPSWS